MGFRVYLVTEKNVLCICAQLIRSPQALVNSGKPEPVEALGWSDLTCMPGSVLDRWNRNVYSSLSQAWWSTSV